MSGEAPGRRWSVWAHRAVLLAIACYIGVVLLDLAGVPIPYGSAVFTLVALALGLATLVGYVALMRRTEGGMFPPWRRAADDPRYASLAPEGKAGWVAGRGALGAPSSADLRAAAVRAVWLDDDASWPDVSCTLRFAHADDIPPATLAKAARRALDKAEDVVPSRGAVRARAVWRDLPGPEAVSTIIVHVRAAAADGALARRVADAFADAFVAKLAAAGHDARRLPL